MLLRAVLARGTRATTACGTAVACGAAAALASCSQQPVAEASWFGKSETFHLRYFDARGAAETSRLVMALAGKDWTDERWPLDFSKPRNAMSPAMNDARAKGLHVANLDRAPVRAANKATMCFFLAASA